MSFEGRNEALVGPRDAEALRSVAVSRTGLSLPALTAPQAGSQLVWRVLGPFRRDVDPVLKWLSGGTQ